MSYNDDIKMLIDAQDLTLPPPEREPQRQYYFIKKCREIVKKKSEELGRPLYACSVCMGCWRVASEIGRDNSFSYVNARMLKYIAGLAAFDSALLFAGSGVFFAFDMCSGGLLLLCIVVVFVGVTVTVAAAALSHLIYKAAELAQENELTI